MPPEASSSLTTYRLATRSARGKGGFGAGGRADSRGGREALMREARGGALPLFGQRITAGCRRPSSGSRSPVLRAPCGKKRVRGLCCVKAHLVPCAPTFLGAARTPIFHILYGFETKVK